MNKTTFKGGLNLKFFEQAEFESLSKKSASEQPLIIARNVLRLITMGWPKSWTELFSWSIIKAIFIQRNPVYLRALRSAFQEGFDYLFKQLSQHEFNEEQKEQIQLYLSNCLSFLPYADLTPYESLKIPQLVNNQWQLIDYYVTPIELTSVTGWRRYFIRDADRVFAYGLQPIVNEHAQSRLIFMGTTYPAGQGFSSHIDADFKAFDTVGTHLYTSGRDKIVRWLAQQKNPIHVCGVSLGGSLSLLCALDQGKRIERVDALNPPGLAEIWYTNRYDHWDELPDKPKVTIQLQANDPISIFGVWKKEWELIHVIPPEEKKGPNAFCDHFLNYAGFADTQFSYLSAEEENKKRIYRNFFVFSLGRWLVYHLAVWPLGSIFRPSAYFLWEQLIKKSVITSLVVALGMGLLYSTIGLTPLGGGLLLLGGLLAYTFVLPKWFGVKKMMKQINEENALLHHPHLPRNALLDIYNQNNIIDHTFTYGDLNTYYKVMRTLVNNKPEIPSTDKPMKIIGGCSKKDFLLASQNPEVKDKEIKVHTVKAKIINIKRTLELVRTIGLHHSAELKTALSEEYQRYCLGKGITPNKN